MRTIELTREEAGKFSDINSLLAYAFRGVDEPEAVVSLDDDRIFVQKVGEDGFSRIGQTHKGEIIYDQTSKWGDTEQGEIDPKSDLGIDYANKLRQVGLWREMR